MDESKEVKVANSQMEYEEARGMFLQNIAVLKEYPRITQRQYVINKTEQHKIVWGDLMGSKGRLSCRKEDKQTTIEAGLFWISQLFQLSALMLSYSKETLSSSAILRTTILEILFAMCGVSIACYKQWQQWASVTKTQDSENFVHNGAETTMQNTAVHMRGFIIASNMAGCTMLFCGFILLLFFDRESYAFLKSMVYFTGLTIFALAIVDNIIMAKLKEGETVIEQDQMRLLLHEVKEELFQELQLGNKYERVKVLRDYIQKFRQFKLKTKSYIYPV